MGTNGLPFHNGDRFHMAVKCFKTMGMGNHDMEAITFRTIFDTYDLSGSGSVYRGVLCGGEIHTKMFFGNLVYGMVAFAIRTRKHAMFAKQGNSGGNAIQNIVM